MSDTTTENTTKLDPESAARVQKVWDYVENIKPYQAYQGQMVADLNSNQQQYMQLGSDMGGFARGAFTQLGTNLDKLAGQQFTARDATTFLNDPSQFDANQLLAQSQINPNQGLNTFNSAVAPSQAIQAQNLPNTNLNAYMNPYLDNVVDPALADVERQRQLAINSGEDRAINAGAYGGSRHGISDAVTNSEAMRQAGAVSGQLRQQGFSQAQALAQQDNTLGLQAQMANQGDLTTRAGLASNLISQGVASQTQGQLAGLQALSQNNALQANMMAQNQQAQLQGAMANQQADLALNSLDLQRQQYVNSSLMDVGQYGTALLNDAGSLQYNHDQDVLQRNYDEYNRTYASQFDVGNMLNGTMAVSPMTGTNTQITRGSPWATLIGAGSAIGGLLIR